MSSKYADQDALSCDTFPSESRVKLREAVFSHGHPTHAKLQKVRLYKQLA